MLLPLAVVAPSLNPDAPDPLFVVDTDAFRATFERWPHPDAVPASGLCKGSLSVGPEGARLAFVDCAEPLRAPVERAFASWEVQTSAAPTREIEILRLAWKFEAGRPPVVFATPWSSIGARIPPDLVVPSGPPGVEGGYFCVNCDAHWCRVEVDVDELGRPTAGEVHHDADCPADLDDRAREDAVRSGPWYSLARDGWPVTWHRTVRVQLRR